MSIKFVSVPDFDCDAVSVAFGQDRQNKPNICMFYGVNYNQVGMVSPAAVTNWPRVNGDGNFGTMWGPSEVTKAKFTLDLTDSFIDEQSSKDYLAFSAVITSIDDKLLDFVFNNQLRVLGRKNLTREEVKMLQIRGLRPKYDKNSSQLMGHTVQTSTAKYVWDGMGGKGPRDINICNKDGTVIANAVVSPGDVVAATLYLNLVYTGVGGDKFGIHWSVQDVAIICQRNKLESKSQVTEFAAQTYSFAQEYTAPHDMPIETAPWP